MEPLIFPASFAQQRLWFLDQLDPGQSVYNMVYAVRLDARLRVAALERALAELITRHEALRTTFRSVDGQPVQVIARAAQFKLPHLDLRGLAPQLREQEARRLAGQDAGQAFDLAVGPLLRVRLLQLSDTEQVLNVVMHHIISDGWSMGVFLRELSVLYEAFSAGKASPLEELP